jgi:siderophore synthetase component
MTNKRKSRERRHAVKSDATTGPANASPAPTQQHLDFIRTLDDEVANQRMTPAQRNDLLEQKALFDAAIEANRTEHPGRIVAYVAAEKLVAGDTVDLLKLAEEKHPGRQIYFEPMDPASVLFEEF